MSNEVRVIAFSNQTKEDKKLLKQFVDFHWQHYKGDSQYIPLLDYEYLGFKLLGMTGFFEPSNLFMQHADMKFFMAMNEDNVVGRCIAFVNHNHNKVWNDKVGFFGTFESVNDQNVANALFDASKAWLKSHGMDTMRGPQNFPVNEATPGLLTEGFDSRPVLYYHYNKPWYEQLLLNAGLKPVNRVLSWEVGVMNPMEEKLERLSQKIIKRYDIKFETWGERPLEERKKEMLEIYNDAWSDNFGFVPFTKEEFYAIVDDMQLVMQKRLFLFCYIKGEAAAFLGAVPNIFEKMQPIKGLRRCELLRAARMLLTKKSIKGFRLGYLGAKKKFRRLGLDGVLIWKQKIVTQEMGYEYADLGWVLEDNVMAQRVVNIMENGKLSKAYTIYEKSLDE